MIVSLVASVQGNVCADFAYVMVVGIPSQKLVQMLPSANVWNAATPQSPSPSFLRRRYSAPLAATAR
jgi:hypothetical protein